MALWDASSGWATLVIRTQSREEARKIATDFYEERDLATSVDLAYNGEDWPRPLDPDGPSEILIEDLS
jgi:hypothetical protein